MPVADVNGQRLYWRERGEGDALLCVMGLGADHIAWNLQLGPWSERYRTIVFDNRDVGRSSRCEDGYGMADLVADTVGLADAVGLERFHLLGMSMGGAIAQHLALEHPDRVRTLTLVCTYAGASRNYQRSRVRVWERDLAGRSARERLEALMLLTYSERFYDQDGAVEWLLDLAMQHPNPQEPEAFTRQARAVAEHDVRDRVGRLALPVHVIGAEHDVLVPVWKSRELADLIPNAELTVIEGSGHAVNVERADELNRAVLRFLDRA